MDKYEVAMITTKVYAKVIEAKSAEEAEDIFSQEFAYNPDVFEVTDEDCWYETVPVFGRAPIAPVEVVEVRAPTEEEMKNM